VAHVLTDRDGGDITQVSALLATVEGRIVSVTADGAYDGETVYQEAAACQHDPPIAVIIPPRSSSVVTTESHGQTVRDRHVRRIAEKGRLAWQKETGYGRRSLVETAIGRYKRIVGSTLHARSNDGQCGEAAIAIMALNRMIRIAKPISVHFP
jgi:Transposase DDE domain